MKKLCFVTASPLTLRAFMRNHMLHLSKHYDVTAVADFSDENLSADYFPCVRLKAIHIVRQIDLRADLIALALLFRFFKIENFDVVHSVTPKAGLLAMTASRLAGVQHRIHCFTGQVWATRTGFGRALLKNTDRVIAANANHILTDSISQRKFLELEQIVRAGRSEVLNAGSISGVDIENFCPNEDIRLRVRIEWGIPQKACLLLFIGRLNRDKGILDLANVFSKLAHNNKEIWLVVVGRDEADIGNEFDRLCGDGFHHVRRIEHVANPAHAMAAADILVLPSYREGFPVVVIEAAACGIPAVASQIYGVTDAVEDKITGLLHLPGNLASLGDCLQKLCTDSKLRLKMGRAARERVEAKFSMESVTAALVAYYENILGSSIMEK